MNRAEYLADRRKRGMLPPIPVDVTATNLDGVTASAQHSMRLLRISAFETGCEILGACEALKITDPTPLPEKDWQTWHYEGPNLSKRGSLLAVRRERCKILEAKLVIGSPLIPGKIRTRYNIVARVAVDEGTRNAVVYRVTVGHAPNKINWALSPIWFANFRRTKPRIGIADFNRLKDYVEDHTNMTARMQHVQGVTMEPWIPSTAARTTNIGGDHLAVTTTLWKD